jgi:hypothetical protein
LFGSNRFTRRWLRLLAIVMSMAVIAGLAASVAPPAAQADTTLNITIKDTVDPLDAQAMQQALQQITDYAALNGQNLTKVANRFIQSNGTAYPDLPAPAPATDPVTGSVALTPDGSGVSANFSSPGRTELGQYSAAFLGGLAAGLGGVTLRGACERGGWAGLPHTGLSWTTINVVCAEITQNFVPYCAAVLARLWAGDNYDPSNDWAILLRGVGTALFPVLAWESNAVRIAQTAALNFAGTFTGWGRAEGLPPDLAAAATETGTVLNEVAADIGNSDGGASATAKAGTTAATGTSNAPTASSPPCDIYRYYATPCTAAYSTTRALYDTYAGPLYQVKRTSDGTTRDIYPVAPGGPANSADQDSFCGDGCTIPIVFDQSPI